MSEDYWTALQARLGAAAASPPTAAALRPQLQAAAEAGARATARRGASVRVTLGQDGDALTARFTGRGAHAARASAATRLAASLPAAKHALVATLVRSLRL